MKDAMNCRAQAETFRALAQASQDESGRAVLLQLSQAWDLLAGAWDSLSAELAARGAPQPKASKFESVSAMSVNENPSSAKSQ